MSVQAAPLSLEEFEALRHFDTCKLANAIEKLDVRMHNEGFTRPGLRCVTGGFPAVIGYAVTSRVRCADPPRPGATYHDLAEWWALLQTRPGPRVAVIEDVDSVPGQGAVLSNTHAEVLRAFGCVGVVTNGAVRNIPSLAAMDFPAFACHVTISHSYVHLVEYGTPVEILGLRIAPADLIYADVHGVLSIPGEHVHDILRVARERWQREARVIDMCRTPGIRLEALVEEMDYMEKSR